MATKGNKAPMANIDFSDSKKAWKGTTKAINTKVKALTEEIVEDIKDNSKSVTKAAEKAVKNGYAKVSKSLTFDNLAKTSKKVNAYTVKKADELVNDAYKGGQEWIKVADKAFKGGIKLAAKQQELVFDALGMIKKQVVSTSKKVNKVISK